jgi:hypothetical protein
MTELPPFKPKILFITLNSMHTVMQDGENPNLTG